MFKPYKLNENLIKHRKYGILLLVMSTIYERCFMPVQKVCVVCGKNFSVPPCRAKTASTCSHDCAVFIRAQSRERKVVLVCPGCGVEFEVPRSHEGRRVYCSMDCKRNSGHAHDKMSARVSGDKNPMWNGGVTNHTQGYKYQKATHHPYASNGYVFQQKAA